MIKLCDPKLKENGNIESILDPSMGTGGFLSMSIKHLNKKHKNIDWKLNKKRIYGFDVDETVKNMSILNALLECGQIFSETFVKRDTLHDDYKISENVLIDKVDIILANEPFGLKNIVHKNVCKRIKDLKIEGTKAEPLFLQLMMQSLNINGRCAVIVPDGVLFNDAKLHKLTRKYLCDKLRLAKVISLEDGLFLNTGVKSSILFFVNDGETEEVEFCKIKMSNGEIVEESVIKVDIEEIEENDYSLFVNKYNIVEEEKIEGIEYKKLGDICELINGYAFKSDNFINDGIGLISIKTIQNNLIDNNKITEYIKESEQYNKYKVIKNDILIALSGATTGKIGIYQNSNFGYLNQRVCKIKLNDNNVMTKYILYYYISNDLESEVLKNAKGSAQPNISTKDIEELRIPIPPLPIQQQIVEALDSIYDTIEGNNKLIQNYEKIQKGIIWSNTLNVEKKKLVDIAEMKIGGTPRRDTEIYWKNGKNLWVSISELNNNIICDTKEKITDEGVNKSNVKLVKKDTILMSFKMSLGKKAIAGKDLYTNEAIVAINGKNVLNKYIYYSIDRFDFSQACSSIATGNLNKEKLEELLIPIPSKQIQQYIVTECEYYDNLINSLKRENERLQNNKIIDMVLKSVSNDNQSEDEFINESHSESEEEPQPKKELTKEIKKVIEEEKPKKTATKGSKSKSNVI